MSPRVVYIHSTYPDGAHAADCSGCAAEQSARKERARWLEWLVDVGYGVDFTHSPHPPCDPQEVADVMAAREPIPGCDLAPGETSADVHAWVLAENTGWE